MRRAGKSPQARRIDYIRLLKTTKDRDTWQVARRARGRRKGCLGGKWGPAGRPRPERAMEAEDKQGTRWGEGGRHREKTLFCKLIER